MLSHGANAAKRHLASQSNDQTSQGCLIALKQANNDLQVIGMIELALEISTDEAGKQVEIPKCPLMPDSCKSGQKCIDRARYEAASSMTASKESAVLEARITCWADDSKAWASGATSCLQSTVLRHLICMRVRFCLNCSRHFGLSLSHQM